MQQTLLFLGLYSTEPCHKHADCIDLIEEDGQRNGVVTNAQNEEGKRQNG